MADAYGTMAPTRKQLQLGVNVSSSNKKCNLWPSDCFLLLVLVPDYFSLVNYFLKKMCYLCMCKRTCVSLCATCVCWCWQSRGWWELNLVLVGVVSSFNWNHSSSCCVLLDLFYFWFLCVALAVPECTLQTRLALNSYLLLSGRGGGICTHTSRGNVISLWSCRYKQL